MQTTFAEAPLRNLRACMRGAMLLLAGAAAPLALAQDAARPLEPVVVTATRMEGRSFDLPASIDLIDAATLQQGQPMVNLSETLSRVPGLVALNRQNYAQDLQISSRGFGARATFGVRGIRLYQDDIPATMPDGQGQTGSFSLMSAQRVEVLRGPFSTLYGNASGGVIAVFTEDGTPRPQATFNAGAGSFDTWTAGAKLTGRVPDVANAGYVLATSRFDTAGYREHSAARRDLVNAKVTLDPAADTHMTFIASSQYQPETQDPLGLTRGQWQANPRGVDPAALLFDTRKTILQEQGGASVEQRITGALTIKAMGYAGLRRVRQYLALTGVGATSSGGVTDLDRDYGGGSVRVAWRGTVLHTPLNLAAGIDADRQDERRRGFVNNNGAMGDLRRDEDDRVDSTAVYAQAEWLPIAAVSLTAGARSASVRFRSTDHYINAQNPDDSGAKSYRNTSPVLGAVFHATDRVNLYASYGEGFETPTLIELAYRNNGTGLNFALDPATSRAAEMGVKALVGARQRINVAAFTTDTSNEIVIDTATGGRTTYKNAGRTQRRGVEALWEGRITDTLTAHVAYTWLRAVFADPFLTGGAILVPPGARLPGVPATSAYAELAWKPGGWAGFNAALEAQHEGAINVNEQNSDAAPAVTLVHARVGFEQRVARLAVREFLRVNNVTNRTFVGSVIVGDTNGRYFEPAPTRNWFAGITARAVF
ncbi:MAG TPA: TonB-dependent receptor [Casimicrobiaceae bacterium]|nr:TonB-dependent receptor [Casimicrobiaceae bacterium]